MKPIPIALTLVVTAALFLAASAQAEEFCASNTAQLKSQLEVAASNGEADTIRIAVGTYPVPSNGSFWYDARQSGDDDFDLTIIGGWTEGFDNFPCGLLLNPSPLATVLDGGDEKRVMTFHIRENTNLMVRGLTFRNGQSQGDGGGLSISVIHDVEGGYTGTIRVERNVFMNNEADFGGALYIGGAGRTIYRAISTPSSASRMSVVNNVFYANHANRFGVALLLQDGIGGGVLGVGIFLTNNTVLRNTQTDGGDSALGMAGVTPNFYVINNNMWGNDGADLWVEGFIEDYRLHNNNIGGYTGRSPTVESNNISVEPEYIPCPGICLPFVLPVPTLDSPLVNAGIHGNIAPFWTMTALDAAGKPRIAEGTVDIGAFENHDRVFSDRFELSN